MALEAQLCPQCGATVQFADAQTEVVCSYCGTTVAKAEAQEVLKVNDLKEPSEADNQKLKNLVIDGRRQDAIYFIRHYTGLGDEHASAAVDNIITQWDGDHVQTVPASPGRVFWSLIILAINLVILVAIVAYYAWALAVREVNFRQGGQMLNTGIGVCGGLSAPFCFGRRSASSIYRPPGNSFR